MYSYSCPFCKQRLLAPAERAGQKTICPKCLRPVTIPDPDDSPLGGPAVEESPITELSSVDLFAGSANPTDPAKPVVEPPPEPEGWSLDPIAAEAPPAPVPAASRPAPPKPPAPPTRRMAPPEPGSSALDETPPPHRPRPQPQPAGAVTSQAAASNGLPTRSVPAPSGSTPSPARPAPLITRRLETPEKSASLVVMNPTGLAGVDLAAELTANLTMRMKPPQEPPSDLRLSTAVAVLLTVVGFGLWIAGIIYDPEPLPFVALLGGLLFAVGWIWAIHLASLMGWFNALIALLPPITIWYLVRPSADNGARPLLYVICGAVLVGLFLVAEPSRTRFQELMASLDPVKTIVSAKPPSPAERIRTLAARRNPGLLQDHLETLASQDPKQIPARDFTEGDRKDLAQELLTILTSEGTLYEPSVRAAALMVIAGWCPDQGRAQVIKALNATEPMLRRAALAEAGRWSDVEMAKAVATRLGNDRESIPAQRALKAIGMPAEAALISMLNTDDEFFQLTLISLLSELGGASSIKALEDLSASGPESEIRREAARVAELLRKATKAKS